MPGLDIESVYRLVIFTLVLVLLLLAEQLFPARPDHYATRLKSNLSLQGINLLIQVGVPLTLTAAALYAVYETTGLFNTVLGAYGLWTKIIICWVVIDLVMYWLHRAYHGIGFLWRVHRLHHGDLAVDVTTTFRTHPIEILFTLFVRAITIVMLGMPLLGVIIYEVLLAAMAIVIHANIRMHSGVDRILRAAVVTPGMHFIHHGRRPEDYNSNFGLVLSVWDRVFGTYRHASIESAGMAPGLQALAAPHLQKLLPLLMMPFKKLD